MDDIMTTVDEVAEIAGDVRYDRRRNREEDQARTPTNLLEAGGALDAVRQSAVEVATTEEQGLAARACSRSREPPGPAADDGHRSPLRGPHRRGHITPERR